MITDEELIRKLAIHWVCPLNDNPQTPYEIGMVKSMTQFGISVLESSYLAPLDEVERLHKELAIALDVLKAYQKANRVRNDSEAELFEKAKIALIKPGRNE